MIILCEGSAEEGLANIPDGFLDSCVTSPPYVDKRKSTYGGISAKDYPAWIAKHGKLIYQKLSELGSLVLNIAPGHNMHRESGRMIRGKEKWVDKAIKVLEEECKFILRQEITWRKTCGFTGRFEYIFRPMTEPLFWLCKSNKTKAFKEELMRPMGGWQKARYKKGSKNDEKRLLSETGSKMSFQRDGVKGEWAQPTDVVDPIYEILQAALGAKTYLESGEGEKVATRVEEIIKLAETLNLDLPESDIVTAPAEPKGQNHPAAFSVTVPERCIKWTTRKGDWVIDPFVGSGTTLLAASMTERNAIGIELSPKYVEGAAARLDKHGVDFIQCKANELGDILESELLETQNG